MGDDADRGEGRLGRPPDGDYASAYLVTLVSREATLFGQVAEGQMVLSEAGRVVAEEWQRVAEQTPNVHAGELVVMPNHLHGIIYLSGVAKKGRRRRAHRRPSDSALLGMAVARLKAAVTRRLNALCRPGGEPVWQGGYRDVAIETPQELAAIRRLIREDPARWAQDTENPGRRVANVAGA